MLFSSLLVKCAACAVPAMIGSAAITPLTTIADVAVIKAATTGNMMDSVFCAGREYRLDEKSNLTFVCMSSTLFVTNWFVDENMKILSGLVVSTGLSAWKDSVFMGGSLSKTTRVIFILRDVISMIPSMYRPDMFFVEKILMVLLFQVPCTLLNALSMDIHIFKTNRGRSERVRRSFMANYPIRFLKSISGNTLACSLNHFMVKILLGSK